MISVGPGIFAVIRLYTAMLRFYPPHFRAEFEAEMQAVFAAEMAERLKGG